MKQHLLKLLLRIALYLIKRLKNSDSDITGLQNALRIDTTQCEQCKQDFIKNTVWQKYCSTDCRLTAHEIRTGKKLKVSHE